MNILVTVRRLAIAAVMICSSSVSAQKSPGSGPHAVASEAYLSRVGTIIFNTLAPELANTRNVSAER
jgi:hypothetical protein